MALVVWRMRAPVAKWLTRWSAKPVFMGSTPIRCSKRRMASDTDATAVPSSFASRILIAGLEIGRLEITWGDQPRLRKENVPGRIEVHPSLRTEPTRRYLRNVQQTVTSDANQLRSVPSQKVPRRLADSCGMCQFSETYRAPLPLVPQCPAQPKQAD